MESVGVNVMEAAALGRPFQLGMLYDCRKDALVPGITLWNQEKLQKSIRSRPQINTDFKVTASDSIDEKSHLLNIDGSLKLSLLGGLINVTGAAKYLNDTKKSFIQQRLTLHYHSTTRFEELTMNHLAPENIAHPDVFDRDTATHVVTAVLYGADACFLFDREVSSDENKTTVEGEVKAAFDKLKFITVDVKANLNMSDVQREAVDKFTVTFYGDIQLPSNPTSFEDALKVFADLPKLLGGNRDLAVPLRVWLYPLNKLHSRASKLLKEISLDLISELESILESLNTTEIKCCDLLRDSPALALPEFHNQIKDMKKNCNTYKTRLMKKLGSLLPQIRGDQIEDSALNDLLNDHDKSPFRERDLSEWLKERERESKVMKTLLRQLKDSGATVEDNLQAILMDLNIGTVVSYTFTSLDWSDVLLPKQKAYLGSSRSGNSNDPESEKNLSWLTPAIHKTMRNNLDIFKKLIDLKKHEPVKFVVSSKQMKNHPGSCVLLYEDGCVEGVCLVNPSKPDPPKAEVKDDSVIINVADSTCPATEELKLLYKMKDDQDWTSQPVLKSQNTVTLTDLRAGTEYEIKCAAVGKLSYTTESDVITVIKSHQTHSARSNSSVPYGLTNQGMTCYLNIVLQTLFMTIKYRKQLLSLKKDVTGAPPEEDISKTLAEFFKELEDKRPYIDTRKIIQAMHITNVHEQHDAAEYLQMILHKTPEPSKVFKGIVETTTTCFTCNNANRARTEFLSIPLSTDDKGKNDVNRALLEYQEVHMMCGDDQLYCVECDSLRDMETANIIIEWPDILILQLKRFEVFDSWSRVPYRKNEYKDDLEINSQKYELYVIINHRGSHSGGHYDALIKDETENWYHCDDKRVVKCSSKTNKLFEDRCMSAYLLFYRRHEEDEEPKKQTVTTDGKRENNQKPNKMKTTPEEQDMCSRISGSSRPAKILDEVEAWRSSGSDAILPKATKDLHDLSPEQLDEHLIQLMTQSYNQKELVEVYRALALNLIVRLKQKDGNVTLLEQQTEASKLPDQEACRSQVHERIQPILNRPTSQAPYKKLGARSPSTARVQESLRSLTSQQETCCYPTRDIPARMEGRDFTCARPNPPSGSGSINRQYTKAGSSDNPRSSVAFEHSPQPRRHQPEPSPDQYTTRPPCQDQASRAGQFRDHKGAGSKRPNKLNKKYKPGYL